MDVGTVHPTVSYNSSVGCDFKHEHKRLDCAPILHIEIDCWSLFPCHFRQRCRSYGGCRSVALHTSYRAAQGWIFKSQVFCISMIELSVYMEELKCHTDCSATVVFELTIITNGSI